MPKKIIAFDLDDTLAPSKSNLPEAMGKLFEKLLDNYQVCVISGGKFGQFQMQLLEGLEATPKQLARLHLLPTCGTRYYLYDAKENAWQLQYAEDFTSEEKQKIISALKEGVKKLGLEEPVTYGDTIEDRESQITFSALGQEIASVLGEEGIRMKQEWDPDNKKKLALRDYVANLIPDFKVRVGGGTSVDITKPGIDKAYGVKKILNRLKLTDKDMLFIGDRLEPGGNDYPVLSMGVDCISVKNWQETLLVIETILKLH